MVSPAPYRVLCADPGPGDPTPDELIALTAEMEREYRSDPHQKRMYRVGGLGRFARGMLRDAAESLARGREVKRFRWLKRDRRARLIEEAAATSRWIRGIVPPRCRPPAITFVECCDLAGVDPDWARERLLGPPEHFA